MRRLDETDTDYWARRLSEVMAVADRTDGEIREAHLALAGSYARLIEIAKAPAGDAADAPSANPQ